MDLSARSFIRGAEGVGRTTAEHANRFFESDRTILSGDDTKIVELIAASDKI